jgi:hypothetical protein
LFFGKEVYGQQSIGCFDQGQESDLELTPQYIEQYLLQNYT